MSRRRIRVAGHATLMLSTTGAVLCLTALSGAPAYAANNNLGPREGANTTSGLSLGETVLIFVVVPAVILFVIAALVWLPGLVKADRYRPQRGWSAPPVWFAGPPDPVAAVETADPGTAVRGGASGGW